MILSGLFWNVLVKKDDVIQPFNVPDGAFNKETQMFSSCQLSVCVRDASVNQTN